MTTLCKGREGSQSGLGMRHSPSARPHSPRWAQRAETRLLENEVWTGSSLPPLQDALPRSCSARRAGVSFSELLDLHDLQAHGRHAAVLDG